MGKNKMELAIKPLRGAQKSVDRSNFSVRNGIHKLVKELGVQDVQISSKAMKVVNDLTCDLIVKFAQTCNEGALQRTETSVKVQKISKKTGRTYMATKKVTLGNTMSIHDLNTAGNLIIEDTQLRLLNKENAINCCKYAYTNRSVPKDMLTYGKAAKNPMIKFPVAYIKRFVKTLNGQSYRIGVGAKALTARVQHLIGELIGMACTTAQDLGDKRITTRHLQLVLTFDKALEECFMMKNSKMRPASAIGAGMPDFERAKGAMVVSTKKSGSKVSMGPAAVFETESVGPEMWACVNPYDRSGKVTAKMKGGACTKGGFPRKGFDGAHTQRQPCTEDCSY